MREHDSDRILSGFAINSLGIKQFILNSLDGQYGDYSRIEMSLQNSEAVVKYKFLRDLHFDIIILEQVIIEND